MALRPCHRAMCGAVVPEDGPLFCYRCMGMLHGPLSGKLRSRHERGENLRNPPVYRALVDEALALLDAQEREALDLRRAKRDTTVREEARFPGKQSYEF